MAKLISALLVATGLLALSSVDAKARASKAPQITNKVIHSHAELSTNRRQHSSKGNFNASMIRFSMTALCIAGLL